MNHTLMHYALLLLGLLLATGTQAQNLSFIHADARWQTATSLDETLWDYDYMNEYVFEQDTLLGDSLYTLVLFHYFGRSSESGGLSQYPQPFQTSTSLIYGAVREDPLTSRVYFRAYDEQSGTFEPTILLYDFDLTVGQEIVDYLHGVWPLFIDAERTEFIYGAERRIWSVAGESVEIIEGIGSTNGPFDGLSTPISGGYTELHQYCQGTAMDCNVAVDGFVNNRRQWNVKTKVCNLEGNCTTYTSVFRFIDTIYHNDHVYFRLQRRNPSTPNDFIPTEAIFRQDSNKVYRFDPDWETDETLIYDFDLRPGDNFAFMSDYAPGLNYDVLAVLPLPLFDNSERTVIWFNPPNLSSLNYLEWYRGIGDTYHPFYPEHIGQPIIDGPSYRLLCYYDDYDGDITYRNPEEDPCEVFIVGTAEFPLAASLMIYPNPSDSRFQLRGNSRDQLAQVRLLSGLGEVLQQWANNEWNTSLQLHASLANGVYWVALEAKDGTVSYVKLLVAK